MPAFVEIIPVKGTSSTTLADLLSSAVGVQVKRYGGLGSFSTVSIRGSTAEQVVVYLDGVPLNQAIGGGADVGRIVVGVLVEQQDLQNWNNFLVNLGYPYWEESNNPAYTSILK